MSEPRFLTWSRREEAWRRFRKWTPPSSVVERATRLAWLEDAMRLARRRGAPAEDPVDAQALRARRRRLRRALARLRG